MIAAAILDPGIPPFKSSFWVYSSLNHAVLNVFGIWSESLLYNVFMFWYVHNIIF